MNKAKKDPILFKMKLEGRKTKNKDDDMKSIDLSSIIIAVSDHENEVFNIEKQYRTQKITA